MSFYSKESMLRFETRVKNEKTIVGDSIFTPPFKLLKPFYGRKNIMRICLVNVSAGILEGDDYNISIHMRKGSLVELYSQAYSKIFKMKTASARQKTDIFMEENSTLAYMLMPIMPFKDSDYSGETNIKLSKNCKLIFREIVSCGRYKSNEVFDFKSFKSRTKIFYESKLIFMDNTVLKPRENSLQQIGLYGGYTHQANMVVVSEKVNEELKKEISELLEKYSEIDFGISMGFKMGIIIRILGKGSEKLIEITDKVYSELFDILV